MIEEPTDEALASVNDRAQALVDQLYEVLGEVCDGETAYVSAMQILLSRSNLGPQQVVDAVTALLGHNLCDDAPIRLTILPAGDETPLPGVTKH